MITFKVDDVKKGPGVDSNYAKYSQINLKFILGGEVESSSVTASTITFNINNFLAALNTAYDKHLSVTLSPDMIWLLIEQGLAQHINLHAEELRHQFVNFEGKKNLIVREDSFIKGQPNDWQHTFGEFSKQIAEYIGKKRDLIVGEFSTTGLIEKAASEIVLMEAVQKYFAYTVMTLCGIPEISLLGTKEDWLHIKKKVQALDEFGLSWWTEKLLPIMGQFIAAVSGHENRDFWCNIFKKVNHGSGGDKFGGWILYFFPYLYDYKTKDFSSRNSFDRQIAPSSAPMSLSKVPFEWLYYDQKFEMELVAGFVGFDYIDNSIRPQIGWVVRDKNNTSSKKDSDENEANKPISGCIRTEIKILSSDAPAKKLDLKWCIEENFGMIISNTK